MWNVVFSKPSDITGHPQQPGTVHFVQGSSLKNTLARLPEGVDMVYLVDDGAQSRRIKGRSLADDRHDQERRMSLIWDTMERQRGNAARGNVAAVLASRKEYAESLPKNWKRPENYPEWLAAQPGAVVSAVSVDGVGAALTPEENERAYMAMYGKKTREAASAPAPAADNDAAYAELRKGEQENWHG